MEDDVRHLRFQYPCRGKAAASSVCRVCRVHHGPHSGVHWAKEGHGDDNSDASLSGSDFSNMIRQLSSKLSASLLEFSELLHSRYEVMLCVFI